MCACTGQPTDSAAGKHKETRRLQLSIHGLRLAAHLLRGCSSRPPPAPSHYLLQATPGELARAALQGARCCSTAMTRPRCVLVTACDTQHTAAPTQAALPTLQPAPLQHAQAKTCASTAGLNKPAGSDTPTSSSASRLYDITLTLTPVGSACSSTGVQQSAHKETHTQPLSDSAQADQMHTARMHATTAATPQHHPALTASSKGLCHTRDL